MSNIQNLLTTYENWMERRPTQALLVHVGVYLAVSAIVICIGLSIS